MHKIHLYNIAGLSHYFAIEILRESNLLEYRTIPTKLTAVVWFIYSFFFTYAIYLLPSNDKDDLRAFTNAMSYYLY